MPKFHLTVRIEGSKEDLAVALGAIQRLILVGYTSGGDPDWNLSEQEPPPIHETKLGIRARKTCIKLGVTTLEQLSQFSADELLRVKNCGDTTLQEIRKVLAEYDLYLSGEEEVD